MSFESVKTTCAYCGVGCGIEIVSDPLESLQGDKSHPANFGRLCQKGGTLLQTMDRAGRFTSPLIYGKESSWEVATTFVAEGFRRIIDRYGPESVAFYVSGQMLTEDYYIANKLMKGYIGSANIDTNSRLCMASTVVGHKKAFGEDLVPGCYEDLELADLIIIVGSNMADCHPVLFDRIRQRRKIRKNQIVVVDPRSTPTSKDADLHLPIRGGSDIALFNGLIKFFHDQGSLNYDYLKKFVWGYQDTIKECSSYSIPKVAKICGVNENHILIFYQLALHLKLTVTVFSQGVNQSSAGTDKVSSILNFHLATGRIGKPGAAPFSLTGQNNAMGGREVGGLANQLVAHMEIENKAHRSIVQSAWKSPTICQKSGLKAVELFESCLQGKVKAIWIMATNPLVSMPSSERVAEALEACDLVVVSESFQSSLTAQKAHVVLPASSWGEKDGMVTNSERCVSRQRAFKKPPGEAKADWWIISQVARKLGYESGFSFHSPREIFCEYAALTGIQNNGGQRCLNLSGFANLSEAEYQKLRPQKWPFDAKGNEISRLFSDGVYYHEDGKARMIPVNYQLSPQYKARFSASTLILITGRRRDQWHTMTRTVRVPSLMENMEEPIVSIHPDDLLRFKIFPRHQHVRVESSSGTFVSKYRLDTSIKVGHIFIPFHWISDFGRQRKPNGLTSQVRDPQSGQPEFKMTLVCIKPFELKSFGFVACSEELGLGELTYECKIPQSGFYRYEVGMDVALEQAKVSVERCLPESSNIDRVMYQDKKSQIYRVAGFQNGQLKYMVSLAQGNSLINVKEDLSEYFRQTQLSPRQRSRLLM